MILPHDFGLRYLFAKILMWSTILIAAFLLVNMAQATSKTCNNMLSFSPLFSLSLPRPCLTYLCFQIIVAGSATTVNLDEPKVQFRAKLVGYIPKTLLSPIVPLVLWVNTWSPYIAILSPRTTTSWRGNLLQNKGSKTARAAKAKAKKKAHTWKAWELDG